MTPPSIFSAWSFANIGMLAWGLAVGIPIAIHFWNRRTQQTVRWAAMDFLLTAIDKQSRSIRLEQWVLLALRMSILALLAVALADPLMTGLSMLQFVPDAKQRQHTVIVIDTSYSMATQSGDPISNNQTFFDLAKSQASDMARQNRQGDGITLITLATSPHAVIGSVAFEGEDVVREIEALTISNQGADLAATITEVERVIDVTARRHPSLEHCRVIFFTDLGRTTWGEIQTQNVQRLIAALAAKADVMVHEIGEPTRDNGAIARLSTATPLAPVHRPATYEAEVHNHSLSEQRRRVEFLVDGTAAAQQHLTIPAEGTAIASFSHRFDTPGQHVIEARIDRDRLLLDNHRWLSVTTPTSIRVLCVAGRPAAARFIALALNPQATGSADFQTDVVAEDALLDSELPGYDCIILANLSRLSQEEVQRLGDFVRAGGGLITVLGDQVQADNYNDQLTNAASGTTLIPATLAELVRGGPHRLDALQYQHSLLTEFRGHEQSGLLTLPVWRYFKLRLLPGSETALAFANGDAALVTRDVGRGRCVLLATAADADSIDLSSDPQVPWSALVSWPSFPPLVHEMVKFAIGGRAARQNFLVGEPWDVAKLGNGSEQMIVRDPLGHEEPTPTVNTSPPGGSVRRSGVYRIEQPGTDLPAQRIAVNLDTHESNLDRLAADGLPSQFIPEGDGLDASRGLGSDAQPSPLFRVVLAIVFLLVLTESTFTWWLGARSV